MFKKRSHYQSHDRPDSDWGPTHSVSSVNRTIAPLTINSWLQTASLYGTPFAERCWIPWNLKFKAIVFTYDSKPTLGCQNTSTTWVPLRNLNLELRFPHLYVLPLFIDSQKFFDELLVVNGHNRSGTFHKNGSEVRGPRGSTPTSYEVPQAVFAFTSWCTRINLEHCGELVNGYFCASFQSESCGL